MAHCIRHFCKITYHKMIVLKLCFKAGIPLRGLLHDLSKYSLTEFVPGAKYYQGTRSPNEEERAQNGYSKAWMHHKGRNRHHFEYWVDYNPNKRMPESVPMPLVYIKEMFCDRIAAGMAYRGKAFKNNEPIEYFLRGNARKNMHPETAVVLEKWLTMFRDEGERKTFRHIRNQKE